MCIRDRCCEECCDEREKEFEWFKLNRSYKELIEILNINIMINNVDLPCVIVNNEYRDDKHLPVGRVNVPVVAEYCNNDVMVITNTDGDFIKNTNVDLIYDKIIMGGNPISVSYTHLSQKQYKPV